MGKSAATIRFVRNEFIAKYDPTVEDTYRKTVDLNGSVSTVELVDTAGTEQFGGMRDLYYKNADGVVMVCAVNAALSVKELSNIRNQVIDIKGDSQVPMVILLNKIDVEKESWVINPKELDRQAKEWGVQVFQVSAKKNKNITEAFHHIITLSRKAKCPTPSPPHKQKHKGCSLL